MGTLKEGTGHLTYASGGHEPALIAPVGVQDPDGVEELFGTGPPVGAFPPDLARFEQFEDDPAPRRNSPALHRRRVRCPAARFARLQWLGLDRLKALFARLASRPPRRLLSELLRRVSAFCRGDFHDDVALLAIRRRLTRKKSLNARVFCSPACSC